MLAKSVEIDPPYVFLRYEAGIRELRDIQWRDQARPTDSQADNTPPYYHSPNSSGYSLYEGSQGKKHVRNDYDLFASEFIRQYARQRACD